MPKAQDDSTPRKVQDDDLVMNLVELALSQPPDTRETYLRTACAGDAELFSQVWDYVQWNHRMQDFLLDPLYPALHEHQFKPGELLADRFRIVREVAQGGMGIVYEAEDERLQRRIALKCAKSGYRKHLSPEVLHASEISHPHVCKIFEIHTASTPDGEIDFLTMEFLEGETLAARLGRGPMPVAEARTIARQMCAGLAEAHRNHVVHGDLKSNNVILARDAGGGVRAVITDFGLARRPLGPPGPSGPSGAGSSQAGGTPDYMAPELWRGEKPSAASDVYALGVILYELATCHRPFGREIPWEERWKHKPPRVRHGWHAILERCLDPDPAKRFRDGGQVAAAFEPSRSRLWWMAAAAAVVLAAVSGAVTYQRATAPTEVIRLAMLPLDSAPDARSLAESVSRDTASALARLKGGSRARLSVVSPAEVIGSHVGTVEAASAVLSATHVVHGTISVENGKVLVHVLLTDARTQATSADWKAEYAPGEVRYAPLAMAGMVTFNLRLPPLAIAAVNAAAKQKYLAGLAYTHRNSTAGKALPLLETAAAADPDSPLIWAALAEAQWVKYFLTKDPVWLERTTESVRQAQNRDLDVAAVHRVTGLLRGNIGFYEQAEAEYQRAIELEPSNPDAYRRLGVIYGRNNRLDLALVALKKAVEVDPNDFKACQDLGAYYSKQGDGREAARRFEKCVELAPLEPDAHRALGRAYSDLDRYGAAERELRKAVDLEDTPATLVTLAGVLMFQERDRDAIPFLTRAVNQSSGESQTWMILGIAADRASLPAESKRAFQTGFEQAEREAEQDPRDGDARSRLAFLAARLNDRRRAETEIAQALQSSSESSATRVAVVWTYEALEEHEKTMQILTASSNDVLEDAARWPHLAELHKNPRFQELLSLAPNQEIREKNGMANKFDIHVQNGTLTITVGGVPATTNKQGGDGPGLPPPGSGTGAPGSRCGCGCATTVIGPIVVEGYGMKSGNGQGGDGPGLPPPGSGTGQSGTRRGGDGPGLPPPGSGTGGPNSGSGAAAAPQSSAPLCSPIAALIRPHPTHHRARKYSKSARTLAKRRDRAPRPLSCSRRWRITGVGRQRRSP